jgi:hypothetical protein
MNQDEQPITICTHCMKALTPSEIKLTIRGRAISWDERQEASDVTADYCATGKEEFERAHKMTLRNAAEREESIRQMDALDKLQMGMNKKNGVIPPGQPT